MDNCKHGNGQDCQQCQYERDVASGYPEPWKLWVKLSRHPFGCAESKCIEKPWFEYKSNEYRRRHDADEIIKEWERGQRKNTFCPECGFGVAVDEDGCCVSCGATAVGSAVDGFLDMIQPDKCATCRPAPPKPMREEPEPGTEYFWFNIYKKRVNKATWNEWIQHRERLNACLCHTTRESAQEWLDWWNEAVGRKA
jgi:hypothetical protein